MGCVSFSMINLYSADCTNYGYDDSTNTTTAAITTTTYIHNTDNDDKTRTVRLKVKMTMTTAMMLMMLLLLFNITSLGSGVIRASLCSYFSICWRIQWLWNRYHTGLFILVIAIAITNTNNFVLQKWSTNCTISYFTESWVGSGCSVGVNNK